MLPETAHLPRRLAVSPVESCKKVLSEEFLLVKGQKEGCINFIFSW